MSSLSFYTLDGTSDRKIYNLLLSKMHKWNLRSKMYHVQPPIKSYSRQQSYILRENEFPSRFLKSCYRFLSCYLLTCRFNLVMINSGSILCFIFASSQLRKSIFMIFAKWITENPDTSYQKNWGTCCIYFSYTNQ